MFGWLKRRVRRENLKLVKQNQLAADYLYEFHRSASVQGLGGDMALMDTLEQALDDSYRLLDFLKKSEELTPTDADNHFKINKELRRLYDQVLFGRKQFAKQFGSSTEPLQKFDEKFVPNEGWEIFFHHFGSPES